MVVAEFKACLLSRRLPPVGIEASETTTNIIISDVRYRICSDNCRSAIDSTISWSVMNSTVNRSQSSGHYMYRQFNIHNSTFCPHSVFMCFVWI